MARTTYQIEMALLGHHRDAVDALRSKSTSNGGLDPCHDLLVE